MKSIRVAPWTIHLDLEHTTPQKTTMCNEHILVKWRTVMEINPENTIYLYFNQLFGIHCHVLDIRPMFVTRDGDKLIPPRKCATHIS